MDQILRVTIARPEALRAFSCDAHNCPVSEVLRWMWGLIPVASALVSDVQGADVNKGFLAKSYDRMSEGCCWGWGANCS